MKEKIVNYLEDTIKKLKDAESKIVDNEIQSIHIDKKYFDSRFLSKDDVSRFENLLEIRNIKKPVLYWFEHTSSVNNKGIQDAFKSYSDPLRKDYSHEDYRYVSSYKDGASTEYNTLYVGKVEKGLGTYCNTFRL